MNKLKITFLIVTSLGVMSCASLGLNLPSNDALLTEQTGQNGRACIRQRDIDGYGILDDDVVSINGRRSDEYYLVTTFFQCNSLQSSFQAGFKSGFSELCAGRDKIVTNEESCPIKSIFEFDSREAAFATFKDVENKRAQLREEAEAKHAQKSAASEE